MTNRRNIGSLQEERAVSYLRDNGFKILECNYRCKIGEIDIIAKKDNILRFIEVKYRKNSDFGYSAQAVSKAKQSKIMKAAAWFLNERGIGENTQCSFDVIAIQGDKLEYIFNSYGAM